MNGHNILGHRGPLQDGPDSVKFFGKGPKNSSEGTPKVTPPSVVDELRDLSAQFQNRIEQAIQQAQPLEQGGQYLGRLLDEGLQAVYARAKQLDLRLEKISAALDEERQSRLEAEYRWKHAFDEFREERAELAERARIAADATGALQEEVNRLGRVVFRSTAASESAIECLRQSLDELRTESEKRDAQSEELDAAVEDMREEIRRRMIAGMLPVLDSLEDGVRFGQDMHDGNGHGLPMPGPGTARPRKSSRRFKIPFLGRKAAAATDPTPADPGGARPAPPPPTDDAALLDGFALVKRRLERILRDEGAERIDTAGQRFDPKLHRAVAVESSDAHPPNTIIREERPGFLLQGTILRYSEVVVSK